MKSKDLSIDIRGEQQEVAVIRLTRPAKRNALNDGLVEAIRKAFENMPDTVRAAVIEGEGEHFCAGLDLSELKVRDAGEGIHHSRSWHVALDAVQYGLVPVIAALARRRRRRRAGTGQRQPHPRRRREHLLRPARRHTRHFCRRRRARCASPLIGVARMTDMMLTGRVYNAQDGERLGFAQYLVPRGEALDKAIELATRIATNAPLTNYALMHALPRIAEQAADHGFLTEALMASIAQSAPEAKDRVRAFLDGKAAKVEKSS
jgi:enoyl-CoA hydratase/carnithine racemase